MSIKLGELAIVVRNTSGVSCVSKDIGRVFTPTATVRLFGRIWLHDGQECPHCGGDRGYLPADLHAIRGQLQSITTTAPAELDDAVAWG